MTNSFMGSNGNAPDRVRDRRDGAFSCGAAAKPAGSADRGLRRGPSSTATRPRVTVTVRSGGMSQSRSVHTAMARFCASSVGTCEMAAETVMSGVSLDWMAETGSARRGTEIGVGGRTAGAGL